MTRNKKIAAGASAAAAAVVLGLGLNSCGPSTKHHATCWKPSYAAHPLATWARNPSALHRHGAGTRFGICG